MRQSSQREVTEKGSDLFETIVENGLTVARMQYSNGNSDPSSGCGLSMTMLCSLSSTTLVPLSNTCWDPRGISGSTDATGLSSHPCSATGQLGVGHFIQCRSSRATHGNDCSPQGCDGPVAFVFGDGDDAVIGREFGDQRLDCLCGSEAETDDDDILVLSSHRMCGTTRWAEERIRVKITRNFGCRGTSVEKPRSDGKSA